MAGEIYAALARLMKPEPEGNKRGLIQSLVSCFPEHRTGLNDILRKLTTINPPNFEPFSVEVRIMGVAKLLTEPETFVAVVTEA